MDVWLTVSTVVMSNRFVGSYLEIGLVALTVSGTGEGEGGGGAVVFKVFTVAITNNKVDQCL